MSREDGSVAGTDAADEPVADPDAAEEPHYGETWVYESLVGAVPGIDLSPRRAVLLQFFLLEGAVLTLAAVYDRWPAAIAGTVAVVVATVGSVEMLRIAGIVRGTDAPEAYYSHLFASKVEVVLAVLAYTALITHLFVVDPRGGGPTLIQKLAGPEPPVLVVYLVLIVLWDLCYRIGTGWWTSVVSLWRSIQYRFDPDDASRLQRIDLETLGFGWLQLALVPFLLEQPVLLWAVVGHVVAVTVVTTLSIVLLWLRRTDGLTRT
ncbi:MAG: hypothetical protein ABEH35_01525 [Haloarculaceae archaeon]